MPTRKMGAMLLGALLIGSVLAPETAFARARSASCEGANLRPSATDVAAVDAATLCLIDELRAVHGLRPLRPNHQLQTVAVRQVNCLVQQNYFADDCPWWLTPAARIAATSYAAHAVGLSIGQNLGWGTGVFTTPAQMVGAWMDSPPHRAIILTGAFNDAGVGVTPIVPSDLGVGEAGATYAIEFAARLF